MPLLPEHLTEISDPPKTIFTTGRPLEKNFLGIAIVGTRKPTSQGAALAFEIAGKLGRMDIPVISGLALGIDSAAHEGCLASKGRTVAVMGGGLDRIYPDSNRGLAERIISGGGSLVSEYPPGTSPRKYQFLARNRIVAGLSSAVIVIEAPERSGSIATAGYAAEYGREVLVFPGNTFHMNYRGSHALIRDGARLVSSFEDIIEDLRLSKESPSSARTLPGMSALSAAVFKAVADSPAPLPVDKIMTLIKLEPREIASALTELTLDGLVIESVEGYSAAGKF